MRAAGEGELLFRERLFRELLFRSLALTRSLTLRTLTIRKNNGQNNGQLPALPLVHSLFARNPLQHRIGPRASCTCWARVRGRRCDM